MTEHPAAPAPPLPSPPPPPPPVEGGGDGAVDVDIVRPGELTAGWQWIVRIAWLGVFIGLSSLWKASRDIGLPTWWLGRLSDPQPIVVSLLPFAAPTLMVVLTFSRFRLMPWLGLVASSLIALIAVFDLAPYPGLGVVELVLAGGATAVSLASFGGRFRAAGGPGADGAQPAESHGP